MNGLEPVQLLGEPKVWTFESYYSVIAINQQITDKSWLK